MAGSDGKFQRYDRPPIGHGRFTGKGRQVDPAALAEVRALLGDRPRQRDLLIEHLHLVQDRYRCLSDRHLAALAHEMGLALTEVFEVATFYHHFDVVVDDAPVPPPVTVRVCDSLSCALAGSEALRAELATAAGASVRVLPAPCVGRCEHAPVAAVGQHYIPNATAARVVDHVARGAVAPVIPAARSFEVYVAAGGYALWRSCRAGERTPESVIAVLNDSGLRGLGGAGFPTGRKWEFVRREPGPRYLAVNADEGEPGTFKDRHYLETDPHQFLEGMLIAAWAVGAGEIFIYLRDEYPELRLLLQDAIARLQRERLSPCPIQLRRGAGAYICGEESAMLESIEGKRGLPRHKPPFPAQVGLFGRPTLINNVETLYWVRDLIERGPGFFTDHGRRGRKGLRSFSVSGRVKTPGVKLAPAGISVRELIDEYCGGMAEGHRFKAYLPGGASGGFLPAAMGDLPLDFGTLEAHGCFIGSAAVIVLSDRDDMRAVALNLMQFFKLESCGQCTPCRVGTEKAVALMAKRGWDKPLLEDLCKVMADASICGLGQAAVNPVRMAIKHFAEEVS
ncbi:MAG: NADH-quinone oxidoreductase subunit F [Alphaproteobacteria bacterium]|nr:NADH-quinone oxidoreductase subunit F [Alphaproteobacteria bacterium]